MKESPVVTAENWLREVVAAATGQRPPTAAPWPVRQLAGHASSRTYWRVGDPGRGSVVVMVHRPDAPPDEIGRDATSGPVRGIHPFLDVARYLSGIRVRVPEILASDPKEGYAVLEDLGDDMLITRLRGGHQRGRLYQSAVDLLAGMRQAAHRAPDPGCVAFQRSYDAELYLWELEHFLEWALAAWKGARLTSREEGAVRGHFEAIAADLAGQAAGFTHRDYQSRNLMVLADASLAVIDFQDALLGPCHYDLVSLLRDSYVVLPQPFIAAMVRRYLLTTVTLGGPDLPEEPFRRVFDLLTVQRKLKDAGRFVYLDRVKNNPDFLAFIPAALSYVQQALRRLPELAELQAILGRYVPELRADAPLLSRPDWADSNG